ncbi:hypothetical protein SDC9_107138 [bioreactor metagenome]|uniref:Uncharacterized protein n=1 Tax=bioreactor metagenome TaxID=1076179 RepID=A0A645B4F2_9ZZZZ
MLKGCFEVFRQIHVSGFQVQFQGHVGFIPAVDARSLAMLGAEADHVLAVHHRNGAAVAVLSDLHAHQRAFPPAEFFDHFFRYLDPRCVFASLQNGGVESNRG